MHVRLQASDVCRALIKYASALQQHADPSLLKVTSQVIATLAEFAQGPCEVCPLYDDMAYLLDIMIVRASEVYEAGSACIFSEYASSDAVLYLLVSIYPVVPVFEEPPFDFLILPAFNASLQEMQRLLVSTSIIDTAATILAWTSEDLQAKGIPPEVSVVHHTTAAHFQTAMTEDDEQETVISSHARVVRYDIVPYKVMNRVLLMTCNWYHRSDGGFITPKMMTPKRPAVEAVSLDVSIAEEKTDAAEDEAADEAPQVCQWISNALSSTQSANICRYSCLRNANSHLIGYRFLNVTS